MYGGSYKIRRADTYFKPRLRTNHASAWKSETCFGFSMESGSWDVFKLKRKAKNKIQAAVGIPTNSRNPVPVPNKCVPVCVCVIEDRGLRDIARFITV